MIDSAADPKPSDFSLIEWYAGACEAYRKGHWHSAQFAAQTLIEKCFRKPRRVRWELPESAIPNALEIERRCRAILNEKAG